jgi:hypothetical protein
MKIVLLEEVKKLGVDVSDVSHMLKACSNKRIYADVYEPTVNEVHELLLAAYAAELEKKRTVLKWCVLISDFEKLLK